MKQKQIAEIKSILKQNDRFNLSDGEAVDRIISILKAGDLDDIELARYFVEGTTEEGDDYLTDYQCLEIVESTHLRKL